jgi:hypothetical protein
MHRVASATKRWSSCSLPVPQAPRSSGVPLLEFVLRNDANEWNKPAAGEEVFVVGKGADCMLITAMRAISVWARTLWFARG